MGLILMLKSDIAVSLDWFHTREIDPNARLAFVLLVAI